MGYSADSFTAGEQPTTAKWNKLWSNDSSFNDGTGIGAGAIVAAKLGLSSGFTGGVTTYTNPGSAGGTSSFFYINAGGIKLFWGVTGTIATSGAAPQTATAGVTFPGSFFNSIQSINLTPGTATGSNYLLCTTASVSTASFNILLGCINGSNGAAPVYVYVVGT